MPRCPRCRTPTELIRYERVPIYNCGSCGGHWVTDVKLKVILSRREVVMPEPVQARMIALADASDAPQPLWCFNCGRRMDKVQFKRWPEIRLDRCCGCGGIWLDRGELEKCQIYWEHFQDSRTPAAEGDPYTRQALLEAEWMQRKADLAAGATGAPPADPLKRPDESVAEMLRRLFQ